MKNILLFFVSLLPMFLHAQIITTIAGNGVLGSGGDGGPATSANFFQVNSAYVDGSGNVYVTDYGNNKVRKISNTGVITNFAGNGTYGYSGDGGAATNAQLKSPFGVIADGLGNIYFSDHNGHRIRKVDPAGIITTIAGTGLAGFTGDGGPAIFARLSSPGGLAFDGLGNLVFVDTWNNRVRKITTSGIITTIAGEGSFGFAGDGGPASACKFNQPLGISIDISGNIYVGDQVNGRIRMIDTAGIVKTIAGCGGAGIVGDGGPATSAYIMNAGHAIADDLGNVYVTENGPRIRKVNPSGYISTVAGNGVPGYSGDGGSPIMAQINNAGCLAIYNGFIYFPDMGNHRVRKFSVNSASPTFCFGRYQGMNVCQDASASSINALLVVHDSISGHPLNWSLISAPTHGIAMANYSTISSGAYTTPAGLSYTPSLGYSGYDTFAVRIFNGVTSDTTWIFVSINPLIPIVGSISGLSAVCIGASTTLTSSVAGGSWSVSNSCATITSTGLLTGITAGIDTITYAIASSCGSATTSFIVTINPLPFAGTISGASTVCVGTSTSLTASVPGGSWTSSNANAMVAPSGLVTGMNTGTVNINYTITNSCGTAVVTKNVTVNTTPSPGVISGLSTVCVGASISLSCSASGGIWSVSNPSASVGTTGVTSGLLAGIDTISYSVTNSCGMAVANKVITVNAVPFAGIITGPSVVCVGAGITLLSSVTGGSWTSASSVIATVSSLGSVTGVSAGTTTISYSVSNSCGTSIATKLVTVDTSPFAGSITGPSVVCVGHSILLSSTVTGGSWAASNPSATVSFSGSLTGVYAGIDTISYTVTNSCGSSVSVRIVTIDTTPAASILSGPSVVCVGSGIVLSASVSGGVWTVSNPNASVSAAGIVTGIMAGIDTIYCTLSNACGSVVTSASITINPLPVAGTLSGPDSVCVGLSIPMSSSVSGGSWGVSNAFGAISPLGSVTGIASGIDTVIYTVGNSCGAVSTTKVIFINAVPAVGISGSDTLCIGTTVSMASTTTGGSWSTSGINVAVTGIGFVTGLHVGIDTIIYTMTNSCGVGTAVMPVYIFQPGFCLTQNTISFDDRKLIEVYPNPVFGSLNIVCNSQALGTLTVRFADILGQIVLQTKIDTKMENTKQVDVSTLSNGVYLLTISGAEVQEIRNVTICHK